MSASRVTYEKTRTERFNLGNYEHIEVSVRITTDDPDLDIDTELDVLMDHERRLAKKLSVEDNSVIHEHPALEN